jgi:hypothetical protein
MVWEASVVVAPSSVVYIGSGSVVEPPNGIGVPIVVVVPSYSRNVSSPHGDGVVSGRANVVGAGVGGPAVVVGGSVVVSSRVP